MTNILDKIPSAFDLLPKTTLPAHLEQLQKCKNKRDFSYYADWVEDRKKWKYAPVSMDTFLDDPAYLGIGKFVYPEVRKMAKDIVHKGFREAIFVAGIGSGKTTLSEILSCYAVHQLLCLRNPHQTYSLVKDKPITIINMGVTSTQALEVTFTGIKQFITKSPWFQRFNPIILSDKIRFIENNILMISGNSKSETALGYNVYHAVLDEAAFYLDNENRQVAEEIYTALQRRIVSRFGNDGLITMISSPKYEGDFMMRKLEEGKKYPDSIYTKQLPTWKCRPVTDEGRNTKFYFDSRKCVLLDSPPSQTGLCKLDDEFDFEKEIWEIPGEYKNAFMQDPDKAKRDFAALPSKTIQGFFPHIDILDGMFDDRESPVQKNGEYKFDELPLRTNYYIHIDLALNKNGKGDYGGFAMAHFEGWEKDEETGEKKKKVVVDLAERLEAGPLGEIQFEDVRNKIYGLKKMGYSIRLVTLDKFQSADSIQILKRKGIRAEYLSVDRTMEPYQTFKECVYAGVIKCHKMEVLRDEMRRLELLKSQKIDHPPGGSKDVSDAVCGAIYNVIKNAGKEAGVLSGDFFTPPERTYNMPANEAKARKEDYYRKLQSFVDRGLIS